MSDIAQIVFLDRSTIPPQTSLRTPSFPHAMRTHETSAPEEVAGRIEDATIVITNKARVDAQAIAGARNLRMIAVAATGTDMVDVAAARSRGIVVSNIRDYAVSTVPEHTFALILALRRSIVTYARSVAAGRWQEAGRFCYFDHPIRDLAGSTLGIFGGGVLGSAVAAIARGFGMEVMFAGRKGARDEVPGRTPFETVLRRADILTLHMPLKPETRHLIGEPEFALMERRPLLINTARGGLVDENALIAALGAGRIAGAGFDVATAEPPPADHPLMGLVGRPDFILTPHVAWASTEATQALADQLVDNVEAFWAGTPRNVVG